jgi:uncharacterized protein (TIGR04255 family)
MHSDNHKRVIYRNSPLVSVVCQLRFPSILKINEQKPADFQECIRNKYPLYQVTVEQPPQLSVGIGVDKTEPSGPQIIQFDIIKNHKFSTLDNNWHINLTSMFLSLSTSKYERWEIFWKNLDDIFGTFNEIYRPAFFERVGLRYINAFKRSNFNLNEADWSQLLKPFVLGFMSNSDINANITAQLTVVDFNIGNDAKAHINAGKGMFLDDNKRLKNLDGEEIFVVDIDMSVTQKNIEELFPSLSYLHDYSTKFIREIITDKLRKAMDPEEIS